MIRSRSTSAETPVRIKCSQAADLSVPAQPNSFPVDMSRSIRPQLRIITSLPPPIIRPIPIRHPALIKSAPLCVSSDEAIPGLSVGNAVQELAVVTGGGMIVKIFSPPAPAKSPSLPRSCRKRRLSIKLKSFLSHLHIRTPPELPPQLRKEQEVPSLMPDRPHRSPGTASFLVTRHQVSDVPKSAGSSSRLSMISRRSRSSRGHLAVPLLRSAHSNGSSMRAGGRNDLVSLSMDISHFSTPSSIRSTSTYGMLERSGSRGSRQRTHSRSGSLEGASNLTMKRSGSMPNLRKVKSVW